MQRIRNGQRGVVHRLVGRPTGGEAKTAKRDAAGGDDDGRGDQRIAERNKRAGQQVGSSEIRAEQVWMTDRDVLRMA